MTSLIAVLLMIFNIAFGNVSEVNSLTAQASGLYCPNDPGDHPSLDQWINDAIAVPTCPEGRVLNYPCYQTHREWYWDQMYKANKTYRLAVCDCWAHYPNNVVAREACIAEAKRTFEEFHTSLWLTYLAMVDACCITTP